MNLVELDRALRQLRLSGMAAVLETRLRQAQSEKLAPIDLVSMLVSDELLRRQDRLLERRHKQAGFRDPDRSLDTFDFDFNRKMNRASFRGWTLGCCISITPALAGSICSGPCVERISRASWPNGSRVRITPTVSRRPG